MAKTRSAETLALDKNQQKKVSKQTKKIKKKLEDGSLTVKSTHQQAKLKAEEKRGLVYIGHIPHGFYEDEMRNYFKQFGKVTNVKVCRSSTTGNSKGFGYVEFQYPEVARIAADSMNNYLMFKKRIVTEFVPHEKRPKGLFHGRSSTPQNPSIQNRRGKQKHSRNKILDEHTVTKKRKNTLKKLASKVKRLKELGIQCNIKPVGIDEKVLQEIKLEKSSRDVYDGDSDVEFKLPSRPSRSKNSATNQSKGSSNKSITSHKSDRAFLTKSLDSVKTLLSSKTQTSSQDEETQTAPPRKTEQKGKDGKKKKFKGVIVKKEKKTVLLNQETVKRIARELIRKRGNPLINLVSGKGTKVKKSPKKK